MNYWLGARMIACLLLVYLLLFACSPLSAGRDTEGPLTMTLIAGIVVPEEGAPMEAGYAFEGEEVTSPGPTITARSGQQVTITLENMEDYVREPHNFVIVAEKGFGLADPLWGAETERLVLGEQQSITFTPDTPGTYVYICSVSDHLSRGMWGSFEVEE